MEQASKNVVVRKVSGRRHKPGASPVLLRGRTRNPVSAAHRRADWRRVEQLLQQFSTIVNDPEKENILPDVITGSLAESLGRVFAFYDGEEQQFMEDLFNIWCNIEGFTGSRVDRFRRLYRDERLERFPPYNPPGDARRRPKPFEASIATCRRLMDLNRVRDALTSLTTGGILGGSVSYGRFFNTCGATVGKASDTDLLLVLPDYDYLSKVVAALEQVEGVDKGSLKDFRRRIKLFGPISKSYDYCIFSHKLKFWDDALDPYLHKFQIPGHYQLSLHVFSWTNFDFMILKDKPILQPGPGGKFLRELWDYRDTRPTRLDNQRSFSGIDYTVDVFAKETEGGFLSRMRVCHIQDERYYPGLHQNLILPQFEIRWDTASKRLYLPLLGFRWKISERLREERQIRPFEVQSLSLSHTRSAVFAPHITRRAERE